MPQYTSNGTTTTGLRVTAVYDTELATVTYTVTDDTGKSASNTVSESTSGNSSSLVQSLVADLGRQGSTMRPGNIASTLASMDDEVHIKAAQANATARATGTDVPSNPTPPPPVTSTSNPEPATTTTETVENSNPENTDPYVQNGVSTVPPVDTNSTADPYVVNGETTIPPEAQKTVPESPTGPAYDDSGFLMPGWSLNENNEPVWVGNNADGTVFVEPATRASADASMSSFKALTQQKLDAQSKATQQDESNFKQREDWRVRLSLSPGATYLYKAQDPGILKPLADTDGIIFPYTPSISVQYNASYDGTDLTHSNYKFYTYKNSSVDSVSISCDFTAQDTYEANYLLAVIHFFRSVTKMFYGQDQNPKGGTPPPLCYLTGLGAFQFDAHPLVITSFNYSLPTDVDYIRAGHVTTAAGVNQSPSVTPVNTFSPVSTRLNSSGINAGGVAGQPRWSSPAGTVEPTYVPTKLQITISAVPIVSRNDISNKFSLKDYATGSLLRGTKRSGGGIW